MQKTQVSISLIVVLTMLLSSCNYYQVAYLSPLSKNIKIDGSQYVYENDTVRVSYDFWDENGKLEFRVFNKLSQPLYIDWNKSAFINQAEKIPYYTDGTTAEMYTASVGSSVAGYYTLFGKLNKIQYDNAIQHTTGKSVKEERVSFIPPQSEVHRKITSLVRYMYFTKEGATTVDTEVDGSKMYLTTSAAKNIFFRNFLTYSTSESFRDEHYIDNGFYLHKLLSMKKSDFRGRMIKMTNDMVQYQCEYVNPTRFYIPGLKKKDIQKVK